MHAHLKSLKEKHTVLDEKIRIEQARAACDEVMVRQMKAQKLHLRRQIERMNAPADMPPMRERRVAE